MADSTSKLAGSFNRRSVLKQLAGGALLAATSPQLHVTSAAASATLPSEPLISVWEHDAKVDIASMDRKDWLPNVLTLLTARPPASGLLNFR